MIYNKLVSFGVASFNNGQYVRETLESIKHQTYTNWELIIVDDASSDDSVAVVKGWLAENPGLPARFIQHEANQGVCAVWNRLVKACRGEFVAIIASDDVYMPDKLALQVPVLAAAGPRVGVVTSAAGLIDAQSKPLPGWPNIGRPHGRELFLDLLEQNQIATMTTLVKRECFDRVGPYDESLSFEDWDMWIRIAKEYEFIYVPQVTAQYRVHPASFTHTRERRMTETMAVLLLKQLGSSPLGDIIIRRNVSELAEKLYHLGSPQARHWLRVRYQLKKDPASLVLLLAAAVGLPPQVLTKSQTILNRLRRLAAAAR